MTLDLKVGGGDRHPQIQRLGVLDPRQTSGRLRGEDLVAGQFLAPGPRLPP